MKNWPFILYKCVADAIGDPIPDFDVKYTLQMWADGPMGDLFFNVSGVKRRSLDNPEERAKLLPELVARRIALGPPWPVAHVLPDADVTISVDGIEPKS